MGALETLWRRSSLALFCLGNTLDVMGQPEEAMTWLGRAIEVDPLYAPAHYNIGNVHLAQGRFAEAIAAYEKATEIDPSLGMVFQNLGMARSASGDHEGAVAAYLQGIEIDPRDAQCHYTLGNEYRMHGDSEEAVTAYERALKIAPDFAEAHCNLGLALQARGDHEAAVAHLRQGDELGRSRGEAWPYDSTRWIVQALGTWFRVLYDGEEFARARKALLEAVEVLPEDPDLLHWVARVMVDPEHDPRVWDGEAALPLATKAVALTHRENLDFLDTLAWARLRSGDVPGAIAVQEEILEKLGSGSASPDRVAKAREQLVHFRAALEEAPR